MKIHFLSTQKKERKSFIIYAREPKNTTDNFRLWLRHIYIVNTNKDVDNEHHELNIPSYVSYHTLTVRLTYLAQSVRIKPNFQGLPWSEFDGLGNDYLITLVFDLLIVWRIFCFYS